MNQSVSAAQPQVQPAAAPPAPAPASVSIPPPLLANQDVQRIAQAVAGILQPSGGHPLQAGLPSPAQPGKSGNG